MVVSSSHAQAEVTWFRQEPFFAWFRRPYLPALWLNRLMPLIFLAWNLTPGRYWNPANEAVGGLLAWIDPLLVWVLADELMSRMTSDSDRSPAFATRVFHALRPYWPRRTINQVMTSMLVAFLIFGLYGFWRFFEYEWWDATISIPHAIAALALYGWIAVILWRCLFSDGKICTPFSLRLYSYVGDLFIISLVFFALITEGGHLSYPQVILFAAGMIYCIVFGGIMHLMGKTSADIRAMMFFPCFRQRDGESLPTWW